MRRRVTRAGRRGLVDFGGLRIEDWTDDAPLVRSLMQSPMWLRAAADIYGEGDATPVVVLGPHDRPRALAALKRQSSGALRLLGGIDIGESVEVLCEDREAQRDLARALARLGRAIDFGHYPTTSEFAEDLRKATWGRGIVLRRALSRRAMPVLPLDSGWAEPLEQFGRSRRQSLRRKQRKAEKMGALETQIMVPTETTFDAAYDRFVEIEARSWKGPAGTALRHDHKQSAFFRNFGRRMARRGQLRLCFLTIGGTDAAGEFAVVWRNRLWSIKLGYDEAFASVSPGELLRLELVAHAVAEGLEAIEFCGKEASWTESWTDRATPIEALRLYPFTPAGIWALLLDTGDIVRRRIANRGAE